MLAKIEEKINSILETNKHNISETDYAKLKAYISVLLHFAKHKTNKEL